MKWSFRVLKAGETEIRIHVTFFLLLIWVGVRYLAAEGAAQAIGSVVFICALFVCVVLHELGHAFAARRYGIRTPDITLLPIGGLARLDRMPDSPRQEFVIAIAGPLVNVVIAGILFIIIGWFPAMRLGFDMADPNSILPNLMLVNIWLVVFNMIPAFPMDGGRVLRALLAMAFDRTRATMIAAAIGQALAVAGGFLGLMVGNPFLILIAVFVFMAAGAEASMTKTRGALQDIPVAQAMITDFRSLRRDAKLSDAVDALLDGAQEDFPVLDDEDRLVGILTRRQMIVELARHDPAYPLSEIELVNPKPVAPDAALSDIFAAFQEGDCQTLPVAATATGSLKGLLTLHNVSEFLMVRDALANHQQSLSETGATPVSQHG